MSGYPKGGGRFPGQPLRPATPAAICQRCLGLAQLGYSTPCPRPAHQVAPPPQGPAGSFKPRTCGGQMLPLEDDELAAFRLGGDDAVRALVRAKLKAR